MAEEAARPFSDDPTVFIREVALAVCHVAYEHFLSGGEPAD